MEKSRAELERWHYEAIRTNPMYRLEGMADVLREELMMNMPVIETPLEERIEERFNSERHPWTGKQWDTINQLRGQVLYLQGKVNEHIDKPISKRKYNKYI